MVTTNGCIKFEFEPTQWRSPSYFCWEWRWFFIPTRWNRKVMIYNYVLCWLYSTTKSVIIALFCSLYFAGFYCIGFSIKLVKNWVRIEEQVDFMRNLWEANPRSSHVRSTWLEAEKPCQAVSFASISQLRPSHEIVTKRFVWRIFKCDFLTLHPYYIYTLITLKCKGGHSEKKNPR